jgi:broad specificity phosphatase PhoE
VPRTGPSIFLVRHGETEWSAAGRHTSRTDVELTAAGRAAAQALGERLAEHELEIVLTSPLRRARDTGALAGFGAAAEIEEELREFEYGTYEGLTTAQIREARPGWDLWRDGAPDGETPAAVGARVDGVIERVLARVRASERNAVLFAHGHVLRVLGARWIGLPPGAGGSLALDTAAVCELGFERERRVIWLWNG